MRQQISGRGRCVAAVRAAVRNPRCGFRPLPEAVLALSRDAAFDPPSREGEIVQSPARLNLRYSSGMGLLLAGAVASSLAALIPIQD